MKKMQIVAMLLAVCLLSASVWGCDKKPADRPDTESKPSNTEVCFPNNVNAEDYRGTKVVYVTWQDPIGSDDGVAVAKFMKEFGIKVEAQLHHSNNYVSSIAASIASGTQGDVMFQSGDFPEAFTVMQPLDAAKLDLTDPLWNQSIIKASALDGHPYLIDAVSNVWSEFDLCAYNKNLFELAETKTPEEYFAEGKWTFENFRYAAQQIAGLGEDYIGASLYGGSPLAAAGASFFTYKDSKVSAGLDPHLYEVLSFLSEMKQEGLLKQGLGNFGEGKVGMVFTVGRGLKRAGYFPQINPDHLGVTYLPVWKEGDRPKIASAYRGWGLVKGAKNPVAAGLFLRQYLDVNNYDLEATFHNQEVAAFFFQIAEAGADNGIFYYFDPDVVKAAGIGFDYFEAWNDKTPDELKDYLESELPVMEEMADKINKIINEE